MLMSDIDVVYLRNPFDSSTATPTSRAPPTAGTTARRTVDRTLDDPSSARTAASAGDAHHRVELGLWYARHPRLLNLMSILAHRMATEDTWDQAAFGEEVARPARDDHLAAGITKRALNHWCFANSKTTFRRIRVEPQLKTHVPVVVHANYHQPKEPRMRAVYDRWHLNQPDALDRFHGEQAFTVPAPQREQHFHHSINEGVVSGANTQSRLPRSPPAARAPSRASTASPSASTASPPRCRVDAELCDAARRPAAAPSRVRAGAELLLVVGAAADAPALTFCSSAASAGSPRSSSSPPTPPSPRARASGAVGDANLVERPPTAAAARSRSRTRGTRRCSGCSPRGSPCWSALLATLLVSDRSPRCTAIATSRR